MQVAAQKDISREKLARRHDLLVVSHFHDLFHRHDNLIELGFGDFLIADYLFKIALHSLFSPRESVDDIPLARPLVGRQAEVVFVVFDIDEAVGGQAAGSRDARGQAARGGQAAGGQAARGQAAGVFGESFHENFAVFSVY